MKSLQLADVVPIIEAAYRVELSATEWLRGVAEAALPLLNRGGGIHAFRCDLDPRGKIRPMDPICVGANAEWTDAWRSVWWDRWMEPMDDATVSKALSFSAASYSTHLWAALAAQIPTYGEFLTDLANGGFAHVLPDLASEPSAPPVVSGETALFYPDSFNLMAVDGSLRGAAIFANLEKPTDQIMTAAESLLWERVAAHLASGYRLRQRLELSSTQALGQLDNGLVVSPGGKVHHAAGDACGFEARTLLRDAALRVDSARGKEARSSPNTVLDLWRVLYDERWSVFDQFDSDGRRFLVARRNPPPSSHASTLLSEREQQVAALAALGHSNKAIAYELGIAISTVAAHVASIKIRLGVSSRAALVRATLQRASSTLERVE